MRADKVLPIHEDFRKCAPVSVVIPCYRCSDTIDRAVASVLAQSFPVAEIILVDDASGDDTLDALQRIRDCHGSFPIRIAASPVNRGAGEARNLGWNEASQPWIAFLDADDAWHPRKIEIQYDWIARHPDTVLCAHQTIVAQDTEWPLPEEIVSHRINPAQLPFFNVIPTRSVMLRRDIPYRFYRGKRYTEDFALWLKIVLSNHPAYKLEVPLACSFRPEFSGAGLSAKLWPVEKGELDTLRTIRNEKLMGAGTYVLALLWSLLKFARRVLLRKVSGISTATRPETDRRGRQ